MRQKGRIFILAFFGLIIFPHRRNAINPSIAWVVRQACAGMNFINMILAETFLSLNRFKQNGEKVMNASPELLQIWFLSHMKEFGHFMRRGEIDDSSYPIKRFSILEKKYTGKSFSDWVTFLKNPDLKGFLWYAKWFHVSVARFSHKTDNPIPLMGITGATSYYPYRVARQYRVLQDIPPPLRVDLFQARFVHKDHKCLDEIEHLENAWKECHPEKIVVPRRLKGNEKIFHASDYYIHHHEIPQALLPVIPEVTMKPTRKAQIENLEETVERKEARISELVRQNKKLRKTVISQLYIEKSR